METKRIKITGLVPLATLPLMLAVCFVMWLLTSNADCVRVEGAAGVWDLRAFDFGHESALVVGAVEYVPNALLAPEAFDGRADIRLTDQPQREAAYGTSRLRIQLPGHQSFRVEGRSVDYAERLFINGVLMTEVGSPGDTRQTTVPDTASFSFTAEPVNGEIVIVRQASNFVHREGGWHDGLYISRADVSVSGRDGAASHIMLGCFLALFLVHLSLFFILRSYRANLYFSLFCLVWFLRTGVTGAKVFSGLLPGLSWIAKFRLEYLALPATAVLIILMVNALFPQVAPRWLRWGVYGLSAAFGGFFLVADPLAMSWALLGAYAYVAAAAAALLLFFGLRFRGPHMGQVISLLGISLFLYAGIRDMFLHSNIVLPPAGDADLSHVAMLFFVFCQMTAMFMGTVHAAEQAKAVEQRLTAENAALDRVNRMTGDLLATMSHEIRTPLAVLSGYAELIAMDLKRKGIEGQSAEDLDKITLEIQRVAGISEELQRLSLAREADVRKAPLSIAEVIRQAARLYAPVLERRKTRLVLELPEDLPPVYGNTGELTQVLFNLLSNANNHTENGTVTVTALSDGRHVEVAVEDTGTGIRLDFLPHVFERYQHDDADGTGLGLAICKEIIEGHGGQIEIDSGPGAGTVVRFTLPAHREEDGNG